MRAEPRWLGLVAAATLAVAACPGKTDSGGGGSGSGKETEQGRQPVTTDGSGSGGPGSGSDAGAGSAPTAGSGKAPMPEVAAAGPGFLHVKGVGYEGVIASGAGPWTPSPQDVADVETALGPAIAAHELGRTFPAAQFKREYSGQGSGTTKTIQIRLACEVDADWQTRGIPAMRGGGACYGLATYNPASHTITDLTANAGR